MHTLVTPASTTLSHDDIRPLDEAELAAAAFLARYSGRTLDAYRHDLRTFFQWATNRLSISQLERRLPVIPNLGGPPNESA